VKQNTTIAGIEYYIFATDGINSATQPAGDPYVVNVKGEEKGSADSFWPLLIIILIAVIIVVIILFFLFKTKKEKRKRD
jgi:multidrug efflux pump subunit AcrB